MAHCARWLLEHDNLGGERAAPHQPSPAQHKWRRLFRRLAAGMSLSVCDTQGRSPSQSQFVQQPKRFLCCITGATVALAFISTTGLEMKSVTDTSPNKLVRVKLL